MKYHLIDPENNHLNELKDYGDDIILEIFKIYPDEINRHLAKIDTAIQDNKFSDLFLAFHTFRRNLEYFLSRSLPENRMMINFESDLRKLMETQRNDEEVSLTASQLAEIEKFRQFANDLLKEVKVFTEEYRRNLPL